MRKCTKTELWKRFIVHTFCIWTRAFFVYVDLKYIGIKCTVMVLNGCNNAYTMSYNGFFIQIYDIYDLYEKGHTFPEL